MYPLEGLKALLDGASTKERDSEIGESLVTLAGEYAKYAGKFLFRSQWSYNEPEWYDHRLAVLDPERHAVDFWTASADNVIRVLPLGGRLLDLCSGDGFYDYWFYRFRADVVCVEKLEEAHLFAVRHWSHPKISHVLHDVLLYEPEPASFDVVLIRGAIEHFNKEDQQRLFGIAWNALKPGGYFCGDTPAKKKDGNKALGAHEFEWTDEAEMRQQLSRSFMDRNIETWSLESETRTTLFWRCRV